MEKDFKLTLCEFLMLTFSVSFQLSGTETSLRVWMSKSNEQTHSRSGRYETVAATWRNTAAISLWIFLSSLDDVGLSGSIVLGSAFWSTASESILKSQHSKTSLLWTFVMTIENFSTLFWANQSVNINSLINIQWLTVEEITNYLRLWSKHLSRIL